MTGAYVLVCVALFKQDNAFNWRLQGHFTFILKGNKMISRLWKPFYNLLALHVWKIWSTTEDVFCLSCVMLWILQHGNDVRSKIDSKETMCWRVIGKYVREECDYFSMFYWMLCVTKYQNIVKVGSEVKLWLDGL